MSTVEPRGSVITHFSRFKLERDGPMDRWKDGQMDIVSYRVACPHNKARYTATLFACGWAGAVLKKVIRASGLEQYAQKAQKRRKNKKGTDRPTNQPTD